PRGCPSGRRGRISRPPSPVRPTSTPTCTPAWRRRRARRASEKSPIGSRPSPRPSARMPIASRKPWTAFELARGEPGGPHPARTRVARPEVLRRQRARGGARARVRHLPRLPPLLQPVQRLSHAVRRGGRFRARRSRRPRAAGAPEASPAQATAATSGRVALFTTCYGNRNEPALAEDLVAVFAHNGIDVRLLAQERCCGMPRLELGDLRSVARLKQLNIPPL